jgi:DNA-binding NarL/FixJ family response regulator
MSEPASREQRVIRLMVVDDEPIFRVGLVACLNRVSDFQVLLEADSVAVALQQLQAQFGQASDSPASIASAAMPPLVVLLSLDLGRTTQTDGLALCRRLKSRYPQLPLLLLSARPEPTTLALALQTGAEGYCPKSAAVPELVTAIRRVAARQSVWDEGIRVMAAALTATPTAPVAPPSKRKPFRALRRNLRRSGLRQIDAAIALLDGQLDDPNLTVANELFLSGRLRELRAARWLVNRLAASEPTATSARNESERPPTGVTPSPPASSSSALVSSGQTIDATSLRSLRSALFDATAVKLQSPLPNLTETPLELDILKPEKKRELLYGILRRLETSLDELRFSQLTAEQLAPKSPAILLDLWQATVSEFFGKYYTLELPEGSVELVELIERDAAIVRASILDKIPFVSELLAHLLFQSPLQIDDVFYAAGTVEAMQRLESILQNLMIQVANAVMQPLLNRVGDVVVIKQAFYDKRLLSSREIERFRNQLSWKYRVEKYFAEPTAIFESRWSLFQLSEAGIVRTSVYAPRNQELAQLRGIPLGVTIALEARDAISPRLRSGFSFVGKGVVYILIEVIGRGIGLVGRGVIKGIGNVVQEPRATQRHQRWW